MPRVKRLKVGAILKSKNEEHPDVRLVGADVGAGKYIVQDADEFGGGPYTLEPDTAAEVYGVTEPPERADEQAGWDSLATAHTRRRAILPERAKTPEEHFADGTGTPVQ